MKGQQAKKGDRVVIVPTRPWDFLIDYIGTVCAVDTDPRLTYWSDGKSKNAPPDSWYLVNEVTMQDGQRAELMTRDLIPLPPDDEARRLFDEESKPKAEKV